MNNRKERAKEVYHEGWVAACDGLPLTACPHDYCWDVYQWVQGWGARKSSDYHDQLRDFRAGKTRVLERGMETRKTGVGKPFNSDMTWHLLLKNGEYVTWTRRKVYKNNGKHYQTDSEPRDAYKYDSDAALEGAALAKLYPDDFKDAKIVSVDYNNNKVMIERALTEYGVSFRGGVAHVESMYGSGFLM